MKNSIDLISPLQTKLNMRKGILLLAVLISSVAQAQDASVLFLGNSYTYSSNLPQMVYQLALANGDTIHYDSSTPGGHTLQAHTTNSTTLNKIASRDWDFVVIQEQSQRPSFHPNQVANEVYPYAEILVDSIKSNYECTEPVFFMTWGRREGDQNNCQFYPPICTFEGMNARLRESYTEMAADNDATVAPCGAAWQQLKFENSTFWNGLYTGDGSHPSAWGTYLNACIFYATMFRESPVGLDFYASIGQADAEVLQQLAEDMVIDSLDNWFIGHQDVETNSDYMNNGLDVSFVGASSNATHHNWDFGDGNVSTEENPQHMYQSPGTYTVQHIASSMCDSDTLTYDVTVTLASVERPNPLDEIHVLVHGKNIMISNDLNSELTIDLLDLSGKVFRTESVSSNSRVSLDLNVSPGLYLIRLEDSNYQSTRKVMLR